MARSPVGRLFRHPSSVFSGVKMLWDSSQSSVKFSNTHEEEENKRDKGHLHLGLSLILGLSRKTDSLSLSLSLSIGLALKRTRSLSLSLTPILPLCQCFFVLIYVRDLGLNVLCFDFRRRGFSMKKRFQGTP